MVALADGCGAQLETRRSPTCSTTAGPFRARWPREWRRVDGAGSQQLDEMSSARRGTMHLTFDEHHYRSLVAALDQGLCTVEVLFDAGGRAVDYRFLDANPAFERQTGLRDVIGRTMRELVPDHE